MPSDRAGTTQIFTTPPITHKVLSQKPSDMYRQWLTFMSRRYQQASPTTPKALIQKPLGMYWQQSTLIPGRYQRTPLIVPKMLSQKPSGMYRQQSTPIPGRYQSAPSITPKALDQKFSGLYRQLVTPMLEGISQPRRPFLRCLARSPRDVSITVNFYAWKISANFADRH